MQDDWIANMLRDLAHQAAVIRAACLYVPIALTAVVALARRKPLRTFASPLLSFLWTLPALLILQRLNQHFGWWTFGYPPRACIRGMPLEIYIGWAVFWGLLPQFSFRFIGVRYVLLLAFTFDICFMFFLDPALNLNRVAKSWQGSWLVGETVALVLVLLPAMLLWRWTEEDTQLPLRTSAQILLSGLVFLYLLPEIAFAARPNTSGWWPLFAMHPATRQLWLQVFLVAALPGLSAVNEFATRGSGTPLPYDPPRRLVTSGIYRFCANPMQLSCSVAMLLEAALLRNAWVALGALVAIVYSAGLAHWDESVDLRERFSDWQSYHATVPSWRFRLQPFHAGEPAILYVAATCGTCSALRRFLESHHPCGLEFRDAESVFSGSLRRLTYQASEGAPLESGVHALGRALEHLPLGWALCSFILRLPVISHCAQLIADTAGLGPQQLTSTCNPTTPRS